MHRFGIGAFVLLAACAEQNRVQIHTGAIDDVTRPEPGEDLDVLHVPTDGYTTQKPGFHAVHGLDGWLQVWQDPRPDANPPPPPAGIDFEKEMLFVATAPDPDARAIEIRRVIRQPGFVDVYATETLGGAHCPAREPGPPPMAIVAFDSTPLDIQVHLDRVRQEDCGPPPTALVVCRVAGSGTPGAATLTARPGQKIDCDSSQSKSPNGPIVDRSWQLAGAPPGSTTKLTLGRRSLGITFFLDAWGTYRIGLEVRNRTRAASAVAVIEAPPPDAGIPVELQWTKVNRNDDPSMYPRVHLHVADVASPADDCSAQTARSWCNVIQTGTVQRAVVRPEPGRSYRAFVVYDDFRLKGAAVACVRTFPKGSPQPKGGQPLSVARCDDTVRSAGAIWEAGQLDPATRMLYDPREGKPVPPPPPAPHHPPPAPSASAAPHAAPKSHAPERNNPF
jgi:hypothetical protein